LLSVHPVTRQTSILASHVGESVIAYADDVKVAKSGKIYFSDATNIAPIAKGSHWDGLTPSIVSLLSSDPTGRLLEYDPATRTTKVLADGIVFANGVALSNKEDYILVSETGRSSIRRYYISGPKAGTLDYFAENLPGIPDGVTIGADGRVYVCLFSLRTPLEIMQPYPFVKKVITSLLPVINVVPERVGLVLVLDQDGNIYISFFSSSLYYFHSPLLILLSTFDTANNS